MTTLLKIGDVVCSKHEATYKCLGLGSCIGLFIHDRTTGNSGGAHIFLPSVNNSADKGKDLLFADHAIEEMIDQLKRLGSNVKTLRAKFTGGAHIYNSGKNVGQLNAESVQQTLINKGIYIAGVEAGGNISRSAEFSSRTGQLTIKINQTGITKTI